MKSWWKVALQGSVVCGLAFVVAVGCEDGSGAPGGGEGGEGAEAAGGSEASAGGSEASGGREPSSAGESSGGSDASGGTGGVEPGAGGHATAGAGGSGEPVRDPDASVARFCNGISEDGQNVTFILEIGEGDEKLTFTANSFECAPADGEACVSIPLGLDVPIALYEQGDPVPWYEGTLFSEAQDQWLFFTILTGQDQVPSLDGVFTNGVIACDDTTYDYAYPPQ